MKNIGTIIKRLQNIMRKDHGVSGDAQRIHVVVHEPVKGIQTPRASAIEECEARRCGQRKAIAIHGNVCHMIRDQSIVSGQDLLFAS